MTSRHDLLVAIAAALAFAKGSVAAVVLQNDTTTVQVNGGEANNGLVPFDGFFRYTDRGDAEETTWSIDPVLIFNDSSVAVLSNGSTGGFGSPTDIGGGVARSEAVVKAITVQADVELVGSNAKTTFRFSSSSPMDGTRFLFYAENDLFSPADDRASFTGSIAANDLELFMFDSAAKGLTVRMTAEQGSGAALSLFGAGVWTAWGTALETGNLTGLSADGANFATIGDLGLAFAWDLSGPSATLSVNYDTQPDPPPAADFDADGDVDGNDFLLWQRGLGLAAGATRGDGDADANQHVDEVDLGFWRDDFGVSTAAVAAIAVPEPRAPQFYLPLLVAAAVRKSRRRRARCSERRASPSATHGSGLIRMFR